MKTLGDRQKYFEKFNVQHVSAFQPLMARVDGRAFHQFTKPMKRPYDERMMQAMQDTTRDLLQSTSALVGYTQSDEISLMWHPDENLLWAGDVQKIVSDLAVQTTVLFAHNLREAFGADFDKFVTYHPAFDARVWNVPTLDESANYFLWREQDCSRNSFSMAGRTVYEQPELNHKSVDEMRLMLFDKGIKWEEYPRHFRYGMLIRRVKVAVPFEARGELPPKHAARLNPDLKVVRTMYATYKNAPLAECDHDQRMGVLFGGPEDQIAFE